MNMLDMLARNLIHQLNPKVFLATGFANLVPVDFNEKFVNGLLYLLSSMIFPTALGYTLPLFMTQAVMEKAMRVKGIMQMHGLKEVHYWVANMLTSFVLFVFIYTAFYVSGRWVFEIGIFSATDSMLMVGLSHQHSLNFLWCWNQIGLAVILQMLVSSHLGGDSITIKIRQDEGAEPVVMGPLVLLDAPWSEQKQKKDTDLPASFSLPEKK